jgi:hypothetical protein
MEKLLSKGASPSHNSSAWLAKGLTVLGGDSKLYRTLLLNMLHGELQTFSTVGNVINQQRFFACNIREDGLG